MQQNILLHSSSDESEPSWRIFSSARLGSWPFPLQLEIENRPKTSQNFDFDSISFIYVVKA